jgi:hypothetical protein
MLNWIINHPMIISGTVFVLFTILAIVSSSKAKTAIKEGKVLDKNWENIGIVSYSILGLMAFIFMVWACSGNGFRCLPMF